MEDKEIIQLYWNRSENAIRETDKKYGKLCQSVAGNFLSNRLDVEECINDTYLTVWGLIPDERPTQFKAFLCKIVKLTAYTKVKYISAKKRDYGFISSLDELREIVSASSSPDEEVDKNELAAAISSFLREQNEITRRIFIRRYWYCDSLSVIASDYNLSENAIASRLYKLRSKLQKYLRKEGFQI